MLTTGFAASFSIGFAASFSIGFAASFLSASPPAFYRLCRRM
jgi:hypothetical protein